MGDKMLERVEKLALRDCWEKDFMLDEQNEQCN